MKVLYRCEVCGSEYDHLEIMDMKEPDFQCPLCKRDGFCFGCGEAFISCKCTYTARKEAANLLKELNL